MEKKTNPRLAKRLKMLILMVVALLIMVAAQPFLWRMVSAATEKLQVERSKAKQIETVRSLRKEVQNEYKKQQAYLDQLTVVVPMRRDILQVIERLEELAQKEGVVVEVVNIREGESIEDDKKKKKDREMTMSIYPLTLSVSLISDPGLILRYVEAVENAREITAVKSFKISPFMYPSGQRYAYKLEMDINFYLQGNGDSERGQ